MNALRTLRDSIELGAVLAGAALGELGDYVLRGKRPVVGSEGIDWETKPQFPDLDHIYTGPLEDTTAVINRLEGYGVSGQPGEWAHSTAVATKGDRYFTPVDVAELDAFYLESNRLDFESELATLIRVHYPDGLDLLDYMNSMLNAWETVDA